MICSFPDKISSVSFGQFSDFPWQLSNSLTLPDFQTSGYSGRFLLLWTRWTSRSCWPTTARCCTVASQLTAADNMMAITQLQSRGPIFEKSYDELMKNFWKSLTYEKLRMSMWLSKNLTKILWKTFLGRSYAKLMTTLQVSHENAKFASICCYWSNILS